MTWGVHFSGVIINGYTGIIRAYYIYQALGPRSRAFFSHNLHVISANLKQVV